MPGRSDECLFMHLRPEPEKETKLQLPAALGMPGRSTETFIPSKEPKLSYDEEETMLFTVYPHWGT